MIAFLQGKPEIQGSDYVVILVGGVGFKVFVPARQIPEIMAETEVKLYTYMAVKEDDISLYGTQAPQELQLFKQLISVSGVGPRLGLAVLSTWSAPQLEAIFAREDVMSLTKVAGVGKKLAQRMLLELRDKLSFSQAPAAQGQTGGMLADAEAALQALGFRGSEARDVLRRLAAEAGSLEELIRKALAVLSKGGK